MVPTLRSRFAAVALLALVLAPSAHAIDYAWNNAGGGNWNVATNWTPNGVPNSNADTATITAAGTYAVTIDGNFTVRTVTLGGATGTQTLSLPSTRTLTLQAPSGAAVVTVNANGVFSHEGGTLTGNTDPTQVTVNGRYDWVSGTANGNLKPFAVTPAGTLALSGNLAKSFFPSCNSPVLTLAGTTTWSDNATWTIGGCAVVTHSGTMTVSGDPVLFLSFMSFANSGTMTKNGGAGNWVLQLDRVSNHTNTGRYEAQTGTITFQSLGNFGGHVSSGAANVFHAAAGAQITFLPVSGETYQFAGTQFTGPGLKSLAGVATASYTFGGTITASNTTFASGTLRGTFTLAGTLGWTGGSFYGSPTIGPGATLALSGSLGKTLATSGPAATLTNQGTITIAGSENLYVENSAVLTNAAGGVLDLQANVGIVQLGGGQSTLNNAGTLRKSGGTGTSAVNVVTINNTGVFDAQSGTLSVAQPFVAIVGMQSSGAGNAFNAQAGAALSIMSDTGVSFSGTTFGGPGAKTIGQTNRTYTYAGTIAAANTTILGGIHTGTFTLNGELTWNAGTLQGGASAFHMTIPAGATFVVAGAGAKSFNPGGNIARITNSGTLRFSSTSSLQGNGGAFIQNTAGGLIEFLAQGGLGTLGSGPSVLENAGTVRFASGTTVPVTSWQVTNTGTISVQSGLFAWSGTNASFGQTAGRLELVGGNMSNQQPLSISGGVLAGTGAIQGPGAVNLSGPAQTRPGTSPGQLTFGGALTQTGTYFAELNGVAPATQYDQLVAQGNVTVGGTLTTTLGFVPPVGTVFRIIDKTSAGAVVGAFGGLPEGAVITVTGVQLQISYIGGDGNDVTLTVFQNSGLICTPFTDVDQASPFCPNVQWMKNRGVTIGCTTTTVYCPNDPTTRLQMAVFMNRLGNVLTETPTVVEQGSAGGNPDANSVVCQTANMAAANYERHVRLDGLLMGLGDGTNQIAVEAVASVDNGANWISLTAPAAFGTVAGRWANVRVNADRDVAPTEVVRYGLRLSRISGTTSFSESRCALRLLTGNRVTGAAP
jgi:hypothetical protein